MPFLSDLLNSATQKANNFVQHPGQSLIDLANSVNERAKAQNAQEDAELQEFLRTKKLNGPIQMKGALELAQGYNPAGMTVWHGSPYKFAAFDPTKIGTGEGAQAYGHGLYVAENKKTAQDYMKIEPAGSSAAPRRTLLGQEVEVGTPEYKVAQLVDELGLSKARKFISDWSKNPTPDRVDFVGKASDVIQNVTKKADAKNLGTGNLYKIDLPDEHIEKMLDWDKPLSEQPQAVKDALKDLPHRGSDWTYGTTIESIDAAPHLKEQSYGMNPTGQEIYNNLGKSMMVGNNAKGQIEASNTLKQLGIPGIKYFDQGSRGAGQGSRNFVVFPGNEHLLKIQDINGNPIK